jgi:hypothetical protein
MAASPRLVNISSAVSPFRLRAFGAAPRASSALGGKTQLDFKRGNSVFVFALPSCSATFMVP